MMIFAGLVQRLQYYNTVLQPPVRDNCQTLSAHSSAEESLYVYVCVCVCVPRKRPKPDLSYLTLINVGHYISMCMTCKRYNLHNMKVHIVVLRTHTHTHTQSLGEPQGLAGLQAAPTPHPNTHTHTNARAIQVIGCMQAA